MKFRKFLRFTLKFIKDLNMKANLVRLAIISFVALFLVHIFACLFFYSAKLYKFESDTWVF